MAATSAAPAGADTGTPARRPGVVLAVILITQLMVILDGTVVNIAMPKIQQALDFSPSSLSWVQNAYALAFGGLLLLGARAGDLLGRRRVFITGVSVFTAGLAARRSRPDRRTPARRPRPAGHRRRDRGSGRADPADAHLPGRSGAAEGTRSLQPGLVRWCERRPGGRRHAHRLGVLALGPVHQRADRHRPGARRPAGAERDRSPRRASSTSPARSPRRSVSPRSSTASSASPRSAGRRPRCSAPSRPAWSCWWRSC